MLQFLNWLARSFISLLLGSGGLIAVAGGLAGGQYGGALLGLGLVGLAWWAWPRRRSSWRDDEPSDRQLAYARDLGIQVPRGASKGQVSDLITAAKAR